MLIECIQQVPVYLPKQVCFISEWCLFIAYWGRKQYMKATVYDGNCDMYLLHTN